MSDIITKPGTPANAAERVLAWIGRRIRDGRLGPGDPLPGEIEIAAATGAGRSSVREALTAMKALGIIRSRRKGGITIIRAPVLLELRKYFGERYDSRALLLDALEFRAAMEWGFGPLALARVGPATLQALRGIVREAADQARSMDDLNGAEARFHTALMDGCCNQLAGLFAHLYTPIFRGMPDGPAASDFPAEIDRWRRERLGNGGSDSGAPAS